MKIDLSGQKIVVTGASRGIGKAIAEQLAEAGAQIAVHYNRNRNTAQRVAEDIGRGAEIFQADLSKPVEVIQLFENVMAEFGRLHAIVNNAGIAISSEVEGDDIAFTDAWSKTMQVNLHATGLLCKKAIEHFTECGGGRIINISSRAAFRGDTADFLAYAASKGGVVALTRSIARAYGRQGIKAFIVAPGFTHTDMADDFIKKYGESYVKNDLALNALTKPEDIAPTVAFLASGMADHATGCTIDINAGSYVH
ncbi:3-oxoacyl-[acyl-carrier protein] reductase [Catalinimonas alkaloidigena]|uniref:SDR family NAD(P)-dependent oxidoreductase n=1 Tax=Catalinimonas alkaloidigena TaxID=1075417 RepID=UPI002405BA9B|nr:SDR family oxidoreductase [Catalinimonas alkaloidigena]MDF9800707.1 3-oxoacyl-[acyl-carrier protein] reductase [Catalinimonas alkaloidigena]